MTNGGYPDEETALAVDDDEEEEDDENGEAEVSETQDDPPPHTDGGSSQQPADAEADSTDTDETTDGSESENVGLLSDGLTKHELIAFVGGFAASYALAAVFYWGIITSGGFDTVPLPMWILLGVVVLSPLALMFGLRETSTIADTLLNRGSR